VLAADHDALLAVEPDRVQEIALRDGGEPCLQAAAMAKLWNESRKLYQPLDLITGQRLDVVASSGLLPLFAGLQGADDAAMAERVFSDLMGDKVEPRKDFIERHARDVRFLDV